jgi:hypothetical protein
MCLPGSISQGDNEPVLAGIELVCVRGTEVSPQDGVPLVHTVSSIASGFWCLVCVGRRLNCFPKN